MIVTGILVLALLDQAANTEPAAKTTPPTSQTPGAAKETAAADVDPELQLANVRRIYVDILTGGESALRIRDLLMSKIQASRLFIITEDEDKADAVLKGAGRDEVFTDTFQSSEGINAHSQISIAGRGSSNQTYSDRTYGSVGVGENENHRIEERKHEAIAAVRLVNKDGDVIWSDTEESLGAKFVGASVDVAEKVTKRLVADYRSARTKLK
jgi:hypothetical protein